MSRHCTITRFCGLALLSSLTAFAAPPATAPAGPSVTIDALSRWNVMVVDAVSQADLDAGKPVKCVLNSDMRAGQTVAVKKGTELTLAPVHEGDGTRPYYSFTVDHVTINGTDVPLKAAAGHVMVARGAGGLPPNRRLTLVAAEAVAIPQSLVPVDTVAADQSAAQQRQADKIAAIQKRHDDDSSRQRSREDAAAVSAATPAAAPEPAKPNIPWPTTAEAANFGTAHPDGYSNEGDNLWNVTTNQLVAEKWIISSPAHLVLDRPDLLLAGDLRPSTNGFSKGWVSLRSPGTPLASVFLPGKEGGTQMFLNADLRRMLIVENGDVFRAEFDWLNSVPKDKKQLTTAGVFAGIEPLYWVDNLAYFNSHISPDKPLLQLDTLSGEIKQLPPGPSGERSEDTCNRGGDLIYSTNGETITVFDLPTATTVTHRNRIKVGGVTTKVVDGSSKPLWVDDDTMLTSEVVSSRTPVLCALLSHNLRTGATRVLMTAGDRIEINGLLPDGKTVDITEHNGTYNHDGVATPDHPVRCLVDWQQAKKSATKIPFDARGNWIDADRYVYGVTAGDLNALGLLCYTHSTDSVTKICGRAMSTNHFEHAIFDPKANTIIYQAASNEKMIRVKLDGSELTELGFNGSIRPIDTHPVDLGLGASSKPLWQPIVRTAAKPADAAPSNDPDNATDTIAFAAAAKDLSAEDKAVAQSWYSYASQNVTLVNFYDPIKVSLKLTAATRGQKKRNELDWLTKTDIKDCVSRPAAVKYGVQRATEVMGTTRATPEIVTKVSNETGEILATNFLKRPSINIEVIGTMFDDALSQARQKYDPSAPGGQANPSTPTAATQTPANPAQSQVDQATQKVKNAGTNKVDKALGKIGNIFKH